MVQYGISSIVVTLHELSSHIPALTNSWTYQNGFRRGTTELLCSISLESVQKQIDGTHDAADAHRRVFLRKSMFPTSQANASKGLLLLRMLKICKAGDSILSAC